MDDIIEDDHHQHNRQHLDQEDDDEDDKDIVNVDAVVDIIVVDKVEEVNS